MQFNKPDLLVHPSFERLLLNNNTTSNYNLNKYFNVLSLATLSYNPYIKPLMVTNNNVHVLHDIHLMPHFTKHMERTSGVKPQCTTYEFDQKIPIYNIMENGPRYVIWTLNDPLTVCATCVHRISPNQVHDAVDKAIRWAYNITVSKSIVVFDLDETLIDKHGNVLDYADELLMVARRRYDLVVMYSHGSSLHVDEHAVKVLSRCSRKDFMFDLILSNNMVDKQCQKNLLHLYNYFPNTRFTVSTLIDDSLYNWTPEYTKLIIPNNVNTLKWALNII